MITSQTVVSATIDWLQYTTQEPLFPSHWDDEHTEGGSGLYGYTHRLVYGDGRVVLFHPERPEMRHNVIMSGSVLDNVQSRYGDTAQEIVAFLGDRVKVTRVDLAVDCMRGCLDFDQLEQSLTTGTATTMARTAHRFKGVGVAGDTLYVGAASSVMRLRIYDKAAEQNVSDFEWSRIELQTRKPKANVVVNDLRRNAFDGRRWIAIIRGFCDFPDCDDWRTLMDSPAVKIHAPKRTTDNTRHWLERVVAPALAAYQLTYNDRTLAKVFHKAAEGKAATLD